MRLTIILLMLFFVTSVTLAFNENGLASVYSTRFQGSRTASGEIFNHDELTAAHRSLPFGALVRITRTDDGRSVIVRINDRGPFVSDHLTDLSRAAAGKLGIKNESDVVPVHIELIEKNSDAHFISNSTIEPASNREEVRTKSVKKILEKKTKTIVTPKSVPTEYNTVVTKSVNTGNINLGKTGLYKVESKSNLKGKFAIQVAGISNADNVEKTVSEFRKQNCTNVFVQISTDKNEKPLYKILLGTFNSQKSAEFFLKSNKCCRVMKAFVVKL